MYLRTFVLDVIHQVTASQMVHDHPEVFACATTQHEHTRIVKLVTTAVGQQRAALSGALLAICLTHLAEPLRQNGIALHTHLYLLDRTPQKTLHSIAICLTHLTESPPSNGIATQLLTGPATRTNRPQRFGRSQSCSRFSVTLKP